VVDWKRCPTWYCTNVGSAPSSIWWAFTKGPPDHAINAKIVCAVAGLAKDLGLLCIFAGIDTDEVLRSRFGYAHSAYQVEYSRNLLFADGKRMQRLFDTVVDRTRSRLNVTRLRTMFDAKQRPHHDRAGGPPRLAAMIETPVYDLTTSRSTSGD